MESIQYIVVRKDLVEDMGVGKTSAQVAHASLGAVIKKIYMDDNRNHTILKNTPAIENWFNYKFTKLVIYVKTKQKLLNLAEKLGEDKISYKLIYDCCLTKLEPEEKDGTTLTCMGIEPLFRDKVPKYLQKLQLLK